MKIIPDLNEDQREVAFYRRIKEIRKRCRDGYDPSSPHPGYLTSHSGIYDDLSWLLDEVGVLDSVNKKLKKQVDDLQSASEPSKRDDG